MRIFKDSNINFFGMWKITTFLSVALIASGIISLFIKGGPLLSIDFTGGTIAQIKFKQSVKLETKFKHRLYRILSSLRKSPQNGNNSPLHTINEKTDDQKLKQTKQFLENKKRSKSK